MPHPLALCVAGVFCCSLLALHLLWVATLHRRSRPTVVSGQLDFTATLFGIGGFLAILRPIGEAAGRVVASGGLADWAAVRDHLDRGLATGPRVSYALAAVVLAAVVVAVWRRRDTLEVHNIEPAAVGPAVAEATAAVGLGDTSAVRCVVRPRANHATVFVRHLPAAATREVLDGLRAALVAAPVPERSAGGGYTVAAAGLLFLTLALFGAFFKLTKQF